MGLDSYLLRKSGGQPRYPQTKLCESFLCGGWECGAFRGSVYEELVLKATGQSLYQAEIGPDILARMSKTLLEFVKKKNHDPVRGLKKNRIPREEVLDLARLLAWGAERGLVLAGRW